MRLYVTVRAVTHLPLLFAAFNMLFTLHYTIQHIPYTIIIYLYII